LARTFGPPEGELVRASAAVVVVLVEEAAVEVAAEGVLLDRRGTVL
jgi:hypothetical protein